MCYLHIQIEFRWVIVQILRKMNMHYIKHENIALNKPASQQHPYPDKQQWGADRAVDGLKSNLDMYGGQCTISADNYFTSEWRVDLQEVLSIHHIFIQYRTGNVVWDENNGYAARFLGFSVYVSNTTNKNDGILCFKDNNYTLSTIPDATNITCITHGRYVIYYNNRTHPPYPAGYSQIAFSELCEVEVYGCPEPGYDGENCSLCPENCQDDQCYAVNKTCLSCVAGHIGSQCIEVCDRGTFGPRCINMCGKCAQNEHCHHINGSCMNGCDPGFYGHQCMKICETGKYGIDCQQRCSAFCHTSGICHHITGACKDGCKSGWKGAECLEVQDYGKTSTTLYVVIASLAVLVINNVVLVLYLILLRKQKKHKTYEQTKKENVFTQDISGYDSVVSRTEENYQELATVTADR